MTYSGPRSDTVTIHLRRFGYPPELVGLRFDGETNRGTLDDERVSITDTPGGRSIAWSFAPDNVIVVSAGVPRTCSVARLAGRAVGSTDPQTETAGRSLVGREPVVAIRSTIARATPSSGTTASLNPACTTAPGIPQTTLDSSSWAIT